MKIKFLGATDTVTGSKHLLITEKQKQVLLDCGLFQGLGKETTTMNRHLGFNPEELEAVILSHAHIDHSGNLPFLVKQGFNGKIYCTPATYEIARILLLDSAGIQEADINYVNRRRLREGLEPLKPLYTERDVEKCLTHFKPIPYHTDFAIDDELSFRFHDVGHILGSASVNIICREEGKVTRLTFSGDAGRYTDLLMKSPEAFPQADYIICESTYGDRLHEDEKDMELRLLNIIRHTCIEKRGKLIIPAFSLGRTQEIIFVLDKIQNAGLLPKIKVFVDSPLSVCATDIMRHHAEEFNNHLQEYIKIDPDPFGFKDLVYISKHEESMKLNEYDEPCIIISASGMMDAGRIKHHLRHTISDPKNTILVVGYCTPGSLGGKIMAGESEVKIFGDYFNVKAEIEIMSSFSAHADYNELLRFLSCQDKQQVKGVFLVHGETGAKVAFKNQLVKNGFKHVEIPHSAEEVYLE